MSKEFLLGLNFRKEAVKIEGKNFTVKEMDAKTSQSYSNSLYKVVNGKVKYDTSTAMTKLVMLTLCDEEGNRIFGDNDHGLIEQLPGHIVEKVFKVAQKLNNLDAEEVEKN